MKLLLSTIIIIVLSFSCSKTDLNKICDVNDPLTELSWLSDIVTNSKTNSQKITISKVVLKDKKTKKLTRKLEGFTIRTGSILTYYSCSGTKLCESGGVVGAICNTYDIIKEEIIYQN